MSALLKGFLKKEVTEAAKKAAAAAAAGGKKLPGNGGALFKQQGASVKGKSRLAEDSDVLAGSGPRRREAQRIEKEDIVENPVPKGQASAMKDVREGRAGKVAGGSEDNVMVNTAGKRTGMQREMIKTQKKIASNEKKLKKLQSQLKTSKKGKRVVDIVRAEKLSDDVVKVKETLKLDKEKLGGKKGMQRRSPPPTKKAKGSKNTMPLSKHSLPDKVSHRRRRKMVETGLAAAAVGEGEITKKANGGRMSRVGLSPAEESRAGVMSEAARRRNMPRAGAMSFRPGGGMVEKGKIMQGYKKGGQV